MDISNKCGTLDSGLGYTQINGIMYKLEKIISATIEKPPSSRTDTADLVCVSDFLEHTPPNIAVLIPSLTIQRRGVDGLLQYSHEEISLPDLALYCTTCDGSRVYKTSCEPIAADSDHHINYTCKNCEKNTKTYSIRVTTKKIAGKRVVEAWKFGEFPTFGQKTSNKLLRLFGDEKEYFLLGRECENHGHGIAAFSYYRRVVENTKNVILDKIIEASKSLKADAKLIAELEAAKGEPRFSKAVASVRHSLPEALLIGGHNPLLLLHYALSKGVNNRTDEECLADAHDIRIVLSDFLKRVGQVLESADEVSAAVKRLQAKKAVPKKDF